MTLIINYLCKLLILFQLRKFFNLTYLRYKTTDVCFLNYNGQKLNVYNNKALTENLVID